MEGHPRMDRTRVSDGVRALARWKQARISGVVVPRIRRAPPTASTPVRRHVAASTETIRGACVRSRGRYDLNLLLIPGLPL